MSKKQIPVIYLGSYCNQLCNYCDREYIKNQIGMQVLSDDDIDHLTSIILNTETIQKNVICFHGGEPFLYVDKIKKILDKMPSDINISILTNGTLIEKNRDFLDKYKERLSISISYDFLQQSINRKYNIDIFKILNILSEYNIEVSQLQWVMDPRDKNIFGIESIAHIVNLFNEYNIGRLSLIPLRHIRGGELSVILDHIDLSSFFAGFIQYIELLYVLNINVIIDGVEGKIDKKYFNDYKQLIFSPDGYIYPEFDFLDYKITEARTGKWKDKNIIFFNPKEDELIYDTCSKCNKKDICGLKFLFKNFEKQPNLNCSLFYFLLEIVIKHLNNLQSHKTLMELFDYGN